MTSKTSITRRHNGTSKPSSTRSTDGRIASALEEYAAAIEAGHPLSKEDLLLRYADIADELVGCLDSLEFIHQVAPQLDDCEMLRTEKDESTIRPSATLGDFRIAREIGRGGMGVVYEAEQLSLGRDVALKVLPFATMLDKLQLKRFKNEARTAATLDHPNIVSVFSVGEERGVHYYAMQLIEGRSLAEVVADVRVAEGEDLPGDSTPDLQSSCSKIETRPFAGLSTLPDSNSEDYFRAVASLGVQAAEALDHAHQQGVIHRDIKPANLMIDAEGKLWVTDFGLARLETDAGMTMTGDLVGTLRYMSPEQALAKRVVVDHRADVYSLGITIYELLASKPAYDTDDRQELLRRIVFEEPHRLRQIDTRIPYDLETIVCKAIEKSPDDRYDTAGELAQDLQRFLANEPIQAKPPTLVQRTAKWSRRHIAAVWSAVAVLSAFVALLSVAAALIADSRNAAVADRLHAEDQRNSAVWHRKRAQRQQYYAEIVSSQTDLANGNLSRVQEKLLRHLPLGNEQDRRGWEWYYLQSLCHPEERTLHSLRTAVCPAWSPDGQYIATADNVWKSDTGHCVRIHTPSLNLRKAVAWSPNSQLLAWGVASNDSAVYLWDRGTNDIRELRDHESSVRRVAFSPDGKQLASCSNAAEVQIWDLDSDQVVRRIETEGKAASLAWSPDGASLAVGTKFGHCVWDVDGGEQIMHRPKRGEVSVSWRPSGSQLAVSTPHDCQIINCSDWTVSKTIRNSRRDASDEIVGMYRDLAWSPSGDRLAITSRSKVEIWDMEKNEILSTLAGHYGHVYTVDWSPDGRRLVTSDGHSEVKIWDLQSAHQPPPIDTRATVLQLQWSTGKNRLVSIDDQLEITTWDVDNASKINEALAVVGDGEDAGLLNPDGSLRAHWVGDFPERTIMVRNARSGAIHSEWRPAEPLAARDFSWAPDGKRLAISVFSSTYYGHRTNTAGLECWDVNEERRISLWERATFKTRRSIPPPIWSPDGARVAVEGTGDFGDNGSSYWSSHVHIVDIPAGRRLLKRAFGNRPGYGGRITSLAWSADGKMLAQGTTEGLVEIIDPRSPDDVVHCRAHAAAITALAWNPDGQRLAVGASDGAVKLIEPRHGNEILTFDVGGDGCSQLAWTSDGKQLAAANKEGVIHCWDAARGYQFSPDGDRRGELAWMYYRLADEADDELRLDCLRRAVQLAPKTLGYRFMRGQCLARLGQYDQAAAEFAAMAPGPISHGMWTAMRQAYALLGARDIAAFRQQQELMVNAGWQTEVWSKRIYPAWLGALVPNATAHFAKSVDAPISSDDCDELVRGAMLYRLDRFAEASQTLAAFSESLGDAPDVEGQHRRACCLYFFAMTRHRMGHDFQARRLLKQANHATSAIPRTGGSPWSWGWERQVELSTLRREAAAMIGEWNDNDDEPRQYRRAM